MEEKNKTTRREGQLCGAECCRVNTDQSFSPKKRLERERGGFCNCGSKKKPRRRIEALDVRTVMSCGVASFYIASVKMPFCFLFLKLVYDSNAATRECTPTAKQRLERLDARLVLHPQQLRRSHFQCLDQRLLLGHLHPEQAAHRYLLQHVILKLACFTLMFTTIPVRFNHVFSSTV